MEEEGEVGKVHIYSCQLSRTVQEFLGLSLSCDCPGNAVNLATNQLNSAFYGLENNFHGLLIACTLRLNKVSGLERSRRRGFNGCGSFTAGSSGTCC